MQALGDWRKSLNWRIRRRVHPTVTIAFLASKCAAGRLAVCNEVVAQREAFQTARSGPSNQGRNAAPMRRAVSGRLPPSMETLSQRCRPLHEGEALEKSTPSATYFRVERGVDFRNFQPLHRSRRLIRQLRLQASRRFAPVAAIKTAETAAVAIARLRCASAQRVRNNPRRRGAVVILSMAKGLAPKARLDSSLRTE